MAKLRFILMIVVLALGLAACANPTEPITEPVFSETGLPVEEKVFASAEFVPAIQTQLSFAAGAQSVQLRVEPGQLVTVGDILAEGDTTQLEVLLAQAQTGVHRAEYALALLENAPDAQTLAAAEAAVLTAEANYDRLDRSGARQLELDAADAQITAAQTALQALKDGPSAAQLLTALSDLDAARALLAQQTAALEKAPLTAPFSGQVIEVFLHNDEHAAPNQSVLLLADRASLQLVTIDLSETDVVRLAVGGPALINIDALPDLKLNGIIVDIGRKSQPGSGVYYQVTVVPDEIPAAVAWGMSAFIEFPLK